MAEKENSTGKGKLLDLDGGDPKKRATGAHPVIAPERSNPAAKPLPQGLSQSGVTTGPGTSGVREPTPFQKAQLSSAFQGAREAQSKATLARTLGKTATPLFSDDEDEPTAIGAKFDGENPAKELVNRDLWKAVQAPVQSREGRRSPEIYRTVINQFAVGNNPRYENDAPDKPRGHIFIWDVSRAMNCEIPHFVGAKELSLAQTVDWLRHEGPMRGWQRASVDDAHQAALSGYLAIALPKDIKIKLLAILLPEEARAADNKPFVAAAGKMRGNKLKLADALGVFAVDCFIHA